MDPTLVARPGKYGRGRILIRNRHCEMGLCKLPAARHAFLGRLAGGQRSTYLPHWMRASVYLGDGGLPCRQAPTALFAYQLPMPRPVETGGMCYRALPCRQTGLSIVGFGFYGVFVEEAGGSMATYRVGTWGLDQSGAVLLIRPPPWNHLVDCIHSKGAIATAALGPLLEGFGLAA